MAEEKREKQNYERKRGEKSKEKWGEGMEKILKGTLLKRANDRYLPVHEGKTRRGRTRS